jgi:hypothetical protein
MASPRRALVLAALAVAASAPLAAAQYTITLTNGLRFESRYRPRDAEYDAQKLVFIDGLGNTIAVAKSDVASVDTDSDARGYGHMLDDTAMAFGWAPNDKGEYDPRAPIASSDTGPTEPEEPIYNVNETPALPVFYTVPTDAVAPQTVAPAPAPPPAAPAEPPA